MDDRFSYLGFDLPTHNAVVSGGLTRVEIDGRSTRHYANDGQLVYEVSHPTGADSSDFGACDCCERVPAGRIARALELLDDDHPAAAVLRGRPAPPGPRPGGRREPTIGELGLCGPDPGDDEARWTPDSDR